MFSEDAYAKKSLSGMPIQILREKSGNEEAEMLSQWLIGAFEAIELKYLKDLVFFVYIDKDKPEEVYEKYVLLSIIDLCFKMLFIGTHFTSITTMGRQGSIWRLMSQPRRSQSPCPTSRTPPEACSGASWLSLRLSSRCRPPPTSP